MNIQMKDHQVRLLSSLFPLKWRRWASADHLQLRSNWARNEYFLRGDTITESEELLLCLPLQTKPGIIKVWKPTSMLHLCIYDASTLHLCQPRPLLSFRSWRQTLLPSQLSHMGMATGTECGDVALPPTQNSSLLLEQKENEVMCDPATSRQVTGPMLWPGLTSHTAPYGTVLGIPKSETWRVRLRRELLSQGSFC